MSSIQMLVVVMLGEDQKAPFVLKDAKQRGTDLDRSHWSHSFLVACDARHPKQ